MMAPRFGFNKKEKLKSRKQIDELFAKGKSFAVFPVRVTYRFLPAQGESTVQAGVTASKKYYKKAVDRNRLKRLLREAYRLQKGPLLEAARQKKLSGYLFFMYTDKTLSPFSAVQEAMGACLKKLEQKLPAAHEDLA